MSYYQAVDLFAGPGGWDVAFRKLGKGQVVLGLETDLDAASTRIYAGHKTWVADVSQLDPCHPVWTTYTPAEGLIASPPCQTFSKAGRGAGAKALDVVLAEADAMFIHPEIDYDKFEDVRTGLVLEPLRWTLKRWQNGTPFKWLAFEQVPPVLPVWEKYAELFRKLGYHVATGNVSAEQYGVPQTRKRAVLLAHLHRDVKLPTPTHRKYKKGVKQDEGDPELKPWVSMAEALGWGMTQRPSVTVAATSATGGPRALDGGSGARKIIKEAQERDEWLLSPAYPRAHSAFRWVDEPAGTIGVGRDTPWWLKGGTGANATVRAEDEPAPTVHFGERLNKWEWEQARNSGPGAEREPRPADAPSYTIRANGSGSHPSGVEWRRFCGAGVTSEQSAGQVPREQDEPAHTITGKGTAAWTTERPATTVQGDPRIAEPGHHERQFKPQALRVTVQEAAVLQSFPPDYPWQGTKTKQFQQVGNAVPPALAEALLREVMTT